MKTLSEAVQMQIVEQAGSTYRSVIMSELKDPTSRQECVIDAHKITQFFIDMMVKNFSGNVNRESPPILDLINIQVAPNGN